MKTLFLSSRPLGASLAQTAPRRGRGVLFLVLSCVAGGWLGGVSPASAQVLVTPTVTFNMATSVYTYSYAVTNNTANTLAIVSFGGMPAASFTVQNLTAPMGFLSTYDSGNGFISFLEDSNPATLQTFAPGSTITPFTFTSTFAPGASTFQALDIFGNTLTGMTQAPVPEPGVVAFLALAMPAVGFLLYRRRQLQRATVSVS